MGKLRSLQSRNDSIAVDAEHYHLESGSLSVRLEGDGDLYKTSDGTVALSSPQQGFTGRVVITDGVLAGHAGNGPMTIDGGAYVASGTSNTQDIQMLAGSLSGSNDTNFFGDISLEGNVDLLAFSGNYGLSRNLEDPASTRMRFLGDVQLADGVTLSQVGLGESK
jgi:autotransporter-associated beta strand protein